MEAHLAHAGVRGSAPSAHTPALSAPAEPAPGAHGLAARRGIVLATGSCSRTLPGLEPDGRRVVTSDDALFAPGLPASVLVPGGGAIGVEYASFHRSMGAEVTHVEAADRIVPLEVSDVSRHLTRRLKKRGIDVQAGARPLDAELLASLPRPTGPAPRRTGPRGHTPSRRAVNASERPLEPPRVPA
ncbi:FAD-dependent oxidoreductase [Streptomyces sp. MBT33]|uniref:FAD-dependent oxidoreductase n=1 Tax=Streptomyces sp. MBT33 TaxID=1488363 RepID=UPI0035ABC054